MEDGEGGRGGGEMDEWVLNRWGKAEEKEAICEMVMDDCFSQCLSLS